MMRGKVTFTVEGQEHALHYTINRLCQMEDDTGKGVVEVCKTLQNPDAVSFKMLRTIFRAGLVGERDLVEAGNIIQGLGVSRAMLLVTKALEEAFAVEGGEGAGKPKAGAV